MSRASLPAITSPASETETTLGTMPERMRGPVSSITATRLLVVPRSIPTILGCESPECPAPPKSICIVVIQCRHSMWLSNGDIQFLRSVPHQVGDVAPAIQSAANFIQHGPVTRDVISRERSLHRPVNLAEHSVKPSLRVQQ